MRFGRLLLEQKPTKASTSLEPQLAEDVLPLPTASSHGKEKPANVVWSLWVPSVPLGAYISGDVGGRQEVPAAKPFQAKCLSSLT